MFRTERGSHSDSSALPARHMRLAVVRTPVRLVQLVHTALGDRSRARRSGHRAVSRADGGNVLSMRINCTRMHFHLR